jgi:hypothetical protein
MVANLNEDLSQRSVLLGDGLKPSYAKILPATLLVMMKILLCMQLYKLSWYV